MKNECVIITYGLTDEQNSFIMTCLPTKEYKVEDLSDHDETDLIAHRGTVLIINAEKMSENGRKLLGGFYLELNGAFDETVIWLGERCRPLSLQRLLNAITALMK